MQNNFTISQIADFWDKVADIYDNINQRIGPVHYQRFTEAIKYLNLKQKDKLLNIWSRTGQAVPYLIKNFPGIEIYNLEVSPEMIKIAQKKFTDQRFFKTDLINLDFADNFFESILSLETLEHAPDPEKFLSELFRILKPGGILVMSLPPKTAELPLRIYDFLFVNHGEGPHRFLSSKEVKKSLKQAGFELILHKGTLLIPVGPAWLQKFGENIINLFQKTPLRELGIRQFYISRKWPIKQSKQF